MNDAIRAPARRRPAAAAPKPAKRAKLARPLLQPLGLSLQFARDDAVRAHRAVLPRRCVARWIRAALDAPAEITVRIVGSAEARALNRDYRGRDYATNVLTFDYADGLAPGSGPAARRVHADLVLCAEVVEAEANAAALPLAAHYAHLLVHGTLHAQGLDHQRDDEAAAMEARETELLLALGFADPYLPGWQDPPLDDGRAAERAAPRQPDVPR